MAVAVKEMEQPVQDNERIARLESHVEHIQSDVIDIKAEVRKLNDKIDTEVRKLHDKIDSVKDTVNALKAETKERFAQLDARFAQLDARFAKLNMSRALDKVWWLLIAASLLGVMARGFKWI